MTIARRIALIILLILLAGAGATPALAGTYEVYACHPDHGNVNESWTPSVSHTGMVAGSDCLAPESQTERWRSGLITRNGVSSNPNAKVPNGVYAAMTFTAPPGATLVSMKYDWWFCGFGGYMAGLRSPNGTWIHALDMNACGTLPISPFTLPLNNIAAVGLMTQCVASGCAAGGSVHGSATIRNVTVTVADSTVPRITVTGGSALTPTWKRGTIDLAFTATDNVGIRYAEIAAGNLVLNKIGTVCNFARQRPCPDVQSRLTLDTQAVPDGVQQFMLRAQDAAGNWGTRATAVAVDNTPPVQPNDLTVLGGTGWRQQNAFSVAWRNPSETGRAPIAGVRYAICPATNPPESLVGCSSGSVNETNVSRLSSIRVPGDGNWVGNFWLRDVAGNEEIRSASRVPLRLDTTPPQLQFGAVDQDDPTRIDIRASDALSGLSRADVEIRRRGDQRWLPVETTRSGIGFSAVLDDEHLPDGIYDLRVRAYDVAGNVQVAERDASGHPATRKVPARIGTRLIAGQVKYVATGDSRGRTHRKRRVVVRPRVSYGRTIPIRGRLTTPGGNPVANANIEVWEQIAVPGADWRRVAVVATNGAGRFKFKALRGPSRRLRFRYPGTPLVRAQTSEVEIRVRARTTLSTRPNRVVNGEEITLRGQVRGGPLPSVGKLVQLQAYSRGRWLTFATPRASATTGRWSYRYRFTATRGTVRYRFRARVPREAGFPYDVGLSRSSFVLVRGL